MLSKSYVEWWIGRRVCQGHCEAGGLSLHLCGLRYGVLLVGYLAQANYSLVFRINDFKTYCCNFKLHYNKYRQF